jgi:hypothetical protein
MNETSREFAAKVRMSYILSQDKEYLEQQRLLNERLELEEELERIKKLILEAARRGKTIMILMSAGTINGRANPYKLS